MCIENGWTTFEVLTSLPKGHSTEFARALQSQVVFCDALIDLLDYPPNVWMLGFHVTLDICGVSTPMMTLHAMMLTAFHFGV